jgi:hypothetical protein
MPEIDNRLARPMLDSLADAVTPIAHLDQVLHTIQNHLEAHRLAVRRVRETYSPAYAEHPVIELANLQATRLAEDLSAIREKTMNLLRLAEAQANTILPSTRT